MKPPHVTEEGHGKGFRRRYRRRLGDGVFRVTLPSKVPFQSPAFIRAYAAAEAAYDAATAGKPKPVEKGSVDAAVSRYLASPDYAGLAKNTRAARRNLLTRFSEMKIAKQRVGGLPIAKMEERHVRELLATLTPEMRRVMKQAVNAMIVNRIEAGELSRNVVSGIEPPAALKAKRKQGKTGRHTWTPEEIEQYRARWAPGTDARLALDLLLLTGQRRGDAVRMGWDMVRDRVLTVEQEKTGSVAHIPVQDELFEAVKDLPLGKPWLRNAHGGAWAGGAAFGNRFADWCDAAKLPTRCRAHGLRKAFCCFWAEKGFSVHQIAAMSGHLTLDEVARYTAAADRLRIVKAMLSDGEDS